MIDSKLAICAVLSVGAHLALKNGLERLPPREPTALPQQISVRVIEPEPPKEPPKEDPPEPRPPEPTPEIPKPVAHVPNRPAHAPLVAPVAKDAPPPDHPAVQVDGTGEGPPVFGVTMESTSQQGGTPMPVGNTTKQAPTGTPAAPKPAGSPPVAAFEATKLPLPQGRCFGKYTDAAKAAGLEGTVVLDLTVDEQGHAREITVVQGLEHGLSDAAIAALKTCRFTPGEKDGKAVAVHIRGFKITFVLQDAQ